tara:strand:- start:238 stop:573 length:336 start_codon:yes stop_codon:yes gene_type:complete
MYDTSINSTLLNLKAFLTRVSSLFKNNLFLLFNNLITSLIAVLLESIEDHALYNVWTEFKSLIEAKEIVPITGIKLSSLAEEIDIIKTIIETIVNPKASIRVLGKIEIYLF